MFCSRCVLPILTIYVLLEEISAAVLPSRNKREVNWLDQELVARLPGHSYDGDLSVGDAGEMSRNLDVHRSHSVTFLAPTEHIFPQRQNQQFQYNRKANEKRRKVTPLDSIGSFQMSSSIHRKDEPDIDWEKFIE